MNSPLVTIICTCYNHQNYVLKTLNSVINQSYNNIELIIVDDASIDNSSITINDWLVNNEKIKFIQNSKNLGITKSFNNAMSYAKGYYYMDLAADDILLPNCVREFVKVYEKNPSAGIVFSNAEMINWNDKFLHIYFSNKQVFKIKKAIQENQYYQNLLQKSDIISSVSAIYKRSVFDELRGYDEELYFEDLDFWLRTSRKHPIAFTNQTLVQKRFLDTSLEHAFYVKSNHTKKLHTSLYLIYNKAYSLNINKSEFKALIPRIYKESRWAIKSLNIKYIFLYGLFAVKTLFKILQSKKIKP